MKKIVIVGGGASGMMAAITAAETHSDAKVCILEHKDSPGKKILSTGNGRCNFTNEIMNTDCYYSDNRERIAPVLERFGTEDTLHFFRRLGIVEKSRNGYYYPRSGQASAVAQVMTMRLSKLGVQVHTGVHVDKIIRKKSGFFIEMHTKDGTKHRMEAGWVILTAGAKAAPVLGSDGSGYALARSFGHSLSPVVPALVQLRAADHPLKKASGVRTEATVRIFSGHRLLGEDTGELQITDYGISGIPVFQVSRHAAKALYYKKDVRAEIDFLPEFSETEIRKMLHLRKEGKEKMSASEFLVGIFNCKLIPCLLKYAKISLQTSAAEFTDEKIRKFSHTCKHFLLDIESTGGFENAQVCAGGVRLTEIDPGTMESGCCEGLYLAGEILDADGICGGYNLQWAWASGYLAGLNAGSGKALPTAGDGRR